MGAAGPLANLRAMASAALLCRNGLHSHSHSHPSCCHNTCEGYDKAHIYECDVRLNETIGAQIRSHHLLSRYSNHTLLNDNHLLLKPMPSNGELNTLRLSAPTPNIKILPGP